MKYVGFIKEHNPIAESILFNSVKTSTQENDNALLSKMIDYLQKGELVLGWMGYFMDLDDKKPICPDSYYTDGTWIWPMYFPHYLRKYPNFPIDKGFAAFARSNAFEINIDPSIDLEALEEELQNKFDNK